MARPANAQTFIDRHVHEWAAGKAATAIPVSVLVAQSALETGFGSSKLYREGNNLFGVRVQPRHQFFVTAPNGQNYAGYDSFERSMADYIWLMTKAESPNFQPSFRIWAGYDAVTAAARKLYPATTDKGAALARARAVCAALGASKFCEGGGYNNSRFGEGGVLYGIIVDYDLIELDRPWPKVPPNLGDPTMPVDPDAPGPGVGEWITERGLDAAENVGRVVDAVKGVVDRIGGGLEAIATVFVALVAVFVGLKVWELTQKQKGGGE